MTPGEARKVIYRRLGQRYTINPGTLDLDLDLTLDNASFKEPGDRNWVRCAVRHSLREQSTLGGMGNRKFKSEGIILCQVFVPTGIITSEVDDLALIGADAFITSPPGARLTLTVKNNPSVGDTINVSVPADPNPPTITTYEILDVGAVTDPAMEIPLGSDVEETAENIALFLTNYDPSVLASSSSENILINAVKPGLSGNNISISTSSQISFSGAGNLMNGYDEQRITDIYFRGSTIKEGPADGKWFMLLVETPFSYYDKK